MVVVEDEVGGVRALYRVNRTGEEMGVQAPQVSDLRFYGVAGIFFAFGLGVAIKTDWLAIFGADYALPARVYFVGSHALIVIFCIWQLVRKRRNSSNDPP